MKSFRSLLFSFFLFLVITAHALPAEKVYEDVKGSVFTIVSVDHKTRRILGYGSAVAVGKHVLATNCHIALRYDYILVKTNGKFRLARTFYHNRKQDLCLLDVPAMTFTPVVLRPSKLVKIGEEVFAVGNPVRTERTLSKGIISNRHRVDNEFVLQTDAAISRGSSGGGLFDKNAKLIGITTSGYTRAENIGFAIPTEWIANVMKGNHHPVRLPTENEAAKAADVAKVRLIGTYGNDNISLYRYRNVCFVFLTGYNRNGVQMGQAIWSPTTSRYMRVFPMPLTPQKSLEVLQRVKHDPMSRTKNYLVLDNVVYELFQKGIAFHGARVLLARLHRDSARALLNESHFNVQLIMPKNEQRTLLRFGLRGLDSAVKAHRKACNAHRQ